MVAELKGSFTVFEQQDHHEKKPGAQSTSLKDVSCLEKLGNLFTEESENLMAIHTKDIWNACHKQPHQ